MVTLPISGERDPNATVYVNNDYNEPPDVYSITINKVVNIINGTPSETDTFDVQVTDGEEVVLNGGLNQF